MERSARALMENIGGELVAKLACKNLVRRLHNGSAHIFGNQPQLGVGLRGGFLEKHIGINH